MTLEPVDVIYLWQLMAAGAAFTYSVTVNPTPAVEVR
jgi:hypothetical protein